MLNRAEVLLGSEAHIFDMHIVLEINPFAALALNMPKRLDVIGRVIGLGQIHLCGLDLHVLECRLRNLCCIRETAHRVENPVASARRHHVRHRPCTWHKACNPGIPNGAPIHVARQMHRRVPTTSHG